MVSQAPVVAVNDYERSQRRVSNENRALDVLVAPQGSYDSPNPISMVELVLAFLAPGYATNPVRAERLHQVRRADQV